MQDKVMLNAETERSAELTGGWEELAQETDTSCGICAQIAKAMLILELCSSKNVGFVILSTTKLGVNSIYHCLCCAGWRRSVLPAALCRVDSEESEHEPG